MIESLLDPFVIDKLFPYYVVRTNYILIFAPEVPVIKIVVGDPPSDYPMATNVII